VADEKLEPDELDITDELIAERHAKAPGDLPGDMTGWARRTVAALDITSLWVGRVACLFLVPLMLSMVYEVVARKLFVAPTDWAFDVSRMLCGSMFMLGAGYALMRGVHIRADFIYRLWQPKNQARIDAILYVLLFFPGMIAFFWVSGDYTWNAWVRWERSMDAAWMAPVAPARTAMPLGALFLIMQGISELLKSAYAIKHNRWPT
jgi:TRAP-type mannitol/chloroaromatic compound transport system permease small subunit